MPELAKPKIDLPDKPQTLDAQDQSPIILNIGDNVTGLTNTKIVVRCHASGVPTPTITWTKDGRKISNDSGDRPTVRYDGSLLIVYSEEVDSGEYTCTAVSIAGEDAISSTVRIVGKLFYHKRKIFSLNGSLPKMSFCIPAFHQCNRRCCELES